MTTRNWYQALCGDLNIDLIELCKKHDASITEKSLRKYRDQGEIPAKEPGKAGILVLIQKQHPNFSREELECYWRPNKTDPTFEPEASSIKSTLEANMHITEVEAHLIREAIEKIHSERFQQHLLQSTGTDSLDAAVAELAKLIKQEQVVRMMTVFNRAISDFRNEAGSDDTDALNALQRIYRVVLRVCTLPLETSDADSESAVRTYAVSGARQSHPLIFAYDRANGTKGYNRLVIANEDEIADSLDTTLCIRLSDYGADSEEEWAHNCVKQIGETLGLSKSCPAYSDSNKEQSFDSYCTALNNALYGRNTGDMYVIARQDDPIPPGVADYLETWLSNLHRFDCSNHNASSNIMRGDPGGLGAWMAQGETAINNRLKELRRVQEPKIEVLTDQSEPPPTDLANRSPQDMLERTEKTLKKAEKISGTVKRIVRQWIPKWPAED